MEFEGKEVTCTALVPIKYSAASVIKRPQMWPAHALLLGVEATESASSSGGESDECSDEIEEEEEINPLLLDPTQPKDQDHYTILGLGKLRYKATNQQIRKAYRRKVLIHHPDKQTEDQKKEIGDNYFKCIQIAYDLMYDQKRRRSYDSIDPTFDDSVPTQSAVSRENFFSIFGPIFSENSRWSFNQPVPQLGNDDSTLEEVDSFYDFWYNFESWREFSYLDEEKTDKAECREERKWMEKQNKIMRQKRKKEEVARLRSLVDNAYSCDPRIKRFKDAEKAKKIARKKAKEEAARLETLEREKVERQRLDKERQEREKKESEQKAQAAQIKKEKEIIKKALRKERKALRVAIKEQNYFSSNEADIVERMQELDTLCEQLPVERLQEINQRLSKSSPEEAQTLFEDEVRELSRRQEAEREAAIASKRKSSAAASSLVSTLKSDWTDDEVQLLVKAVTVYPAGTIKRWETIATYLNTHSPASFKDKSDKDVISKVKNMQKLDAVDKEKQNKMAFSTFEQKQKAKEKVSAAIAAESIPTERFDTSRPWTADEQKLLEQALRKFPSDVADRWNKIAEAVGSRTKAECIARFKELVARIKAKKSQTTS